MKKYISIVACLFAWYLMNASAAYNYINNQRVAGATTNGTTWALAYTSITNINNSAAGDTNCVAFCHDETGPAATSFLINPPGTKIAHTMVLCTDTNTEPPTVVTNSAVSRTSTTGQLTFGVGFCDIDGVSFFVGSGVNNATISFANNSAPWGYSLRNLTLGITNGGGSSRVTFGVAGSVRDQSMVLQNVKLRFGTVGQAVVASSCKLLWTDTPDSILLGSIVPTNLFLNSVAGQNSRWELRGVNLSAWTNGTTLLNIGASPGSCGQFKLYNCKLGSGVGMVIGSASGPGAPELWLYNSDSTNTNYRFYKYNANGEESSETTIVKTDGATDGTTPVSRMLTSSTQASFYNPFQSEWFYGWNDTTGTPITLGVNIITDSWTNANNDAWIEIESEDTSGLPLSLFYNTSATNALATGALYATNAATTWSIGAIVNPIKQTLGVTVTPQQKGWWRGRLCIAKTSHTIYLDPMFTNGFSRAYMSGSDGMFNTVTNSGGGGTTTIIGGGSTFSQ
jgi:hypothetical protein